MKNIPIEHFTYVSKTDRLVAEMSDFSDVNIRDEINVLGGFTVSVPNGKQYNYTPTQVVHENGDLICWEFTSLGEVSPAVVIYND